MSKYIKEACVETFQQAVNAEKEGADRIELCAALHLDGLTPSEDLILQVKKQLNIPVRVMIRPRGGDFVYSEAELDQMQASVEFCKTVGVEGVVFGILNRDRTLNLKAISKITNIAQPLKVIIHKAVDHTPYPLESLRELCKITGITGVLTSGGARTAFEGKEILKEMLNLSGEQLEIVVAGKVTHLNNEEMHKLINAKAYHGKLIVGSL